MPVKSPFRYPGGKSKAAVRNMILSYMPSDTMEYREPFVGGGGVYFGLTPNQAPNRWINDINPYLISVYGALRERGENFMAVCREIAAPKAGEEEVSTKTAKGKKYNKRLGEIFTKFAEDKEMDSALRYFFLNRTVWAGRVDYERPSRLYYSNPTGWKLVHKVGVLEGIIEHLRGTRITNVGYDELLDVKGEKVWIYLDPPYYVDTKMVNTDKQYAYGFKLEDHFRFRDACLRCEHKICISYDDCPFVRDLFKDAFHIYSHSWTYCGGDEAGTDGKKKIGKELIITNYVPEKENIILDK